MLEMVAIAYCDTRVAIVNFVPKMSDKESSSSSSAETTVSPNCGNCRNHGIIQKLRGHKPKCQFRDCQCSCCILNVRRRVVMAAQNAHIRQQKMEEKMAADGINVTPPPSRGEMQLETTARPPTPAANTDAASHFSRRIISDLEDHSYAANELIKMFSLDMNALPFVYGILGVAGDMRTAIELVSEANRQLMANPEYINIHAGPSAFTGNRSADPRMQMGVLSLVKPRNHEYSKDRSPSPPRL